MRFSLSNVNSSTEDAAPAVIPDWIMALYTSLPYTSCSLSSEALKGVEEWEVETQLFGGAKWAWYGLPCPPMAEFLVVMCTGRSQL